MLLPTNCKPFQPNPKQQGEIRVVLVKGSLLLVSVSALEQLLREGPWTEPAPLSQKKKKKYNVEITQERAEKNNQIYLEIFHFTSFTSVQSSQNLGTAETYI